MGFPTLEKSGFVAANGQPLRAQAATPTAAESAPAYAAASQGRRVSGWRVSGGGPNVTTLWGLSTIRERSRDRARNDAWGKAAPERIVSNMVGTGITALPLGGTESWRKRARALWEISMTEMDADGVLDGYGLQALAVRAWMESGEVFVRARYRRPSDGLAVPFQVQILEAEHCPEDWNQMNGANEIRAGIEFTPYGKRAAYWLYPRHPNDGVMTGQSQQPVRVPAEQIIHLYEPLRPGQLRGIPDAASVLLRMRNVDGFDDATLDRQTMAAQITMVVKSPLGADVMGVQEATDAGAAGTSDDGVPEIGLEPGTTLTLAEGEEAQFPTYPDAGANYPDYMRQQMLAVCAAYGVPYEVLVGDMRNVSDRTLRVIINEFRRRIEQRQWLYLIPQYCAQVRRWWLAQAVLSGALDAPGYDDPMKRRDYERVRWIPQGWPYMHPVQDVQAKALEVENRFVSRDDVILERGDDPAGVDASIKESETRAARMNIALPPIAAKPPAPGNSADTGSQT